MSTAPRDQDRLARALERARASEDRVVAARVRDEGAQLVSLLCGVLRMVHMHAPDNSAFDKPMSDLAAVLARLVELLGPVHLALVEDQIYLNDIRVRLDERGDSAKELAAELRKHAVGGITFRDALPEAALRAFSGIFAARPPESGRRAALQRALAARGVQDVELTGVFRFRVTGEVAPSHASPAARLERAAGLVAETFANLAADRMPNPLPIRRAVAEMIDAGSSEEAVPEPVGSPELAAHAVRVTKLALLIGEEAGLPDGVLQDLGVAAMLHDVGYAAREGRGPGLPGKATPRGRHGSAGARLLLRQRGFHEAKVRRVRAVLGHHADHSSGPPLLARILRIAEDYDTATAARGGALAPDEALARIAGGAGKTYDPVLVQALVNALGRWPPGTLVTLADGRRARVVAPARTAARFNRPTVVVETLADGSAAPPAPPLDLDEAGLAVSGSAFATAPPADIDDFVLVDEPAVAAAPAETGMLYGTVLAHLLSRIHTERLSGTLQLEQGADRAVVHFSRGGVADADELRARLAPALHWDEGRFELRCTPDHDDAGETASLAPVVLAAVRAQTDADVVRHDLGDIDRRVIPAAEPDSTAARALDAAELFVLTAIDGNLTARQVLAATGLSALEAQRALLALALTGLVHF